MSLGASTLENSTEVRTASWGNSSEFDDFNYVPVSPWGPISLIFGVISLAGYFGMFGLYVAFLGVILAILALVRLKALAGMVKGRPLAVIGLLLSSTSLVFGSINMAHNYQTECPEGFRRVSFPRDISEKQFLYVGSFRKLHPDVVPLIGQKVFLKGFMWQTEKADGLTRFILLKDNGECCFGGKAQPYDMMEVVLQDNKTTRAYMSMVAVAGVLRANVNAGEDEPVYTMEATLVEEARTGF